MHKTCFYYSVSCIGVLCVAGCCQENGMDVICISNGINDNTCEGIYPFLQHDDSLLFKAVKLFHYSFAPYKINVFMTN